MNSTDTAALEPWQPPASPDNPRSPFKQVLIALKPAVLPIVVGAISWVVSAHGGAHSVGDTIAPLAITAAGATAGTIQTVAAARATRHHATDPGQSEPRTGLLAVRAGLVAWAIAGLSALAAADVYTDNTGMRILYTLIAAAAPVTYSRLASEHHTEMHLALTQRLALEESAHRATITVEQMRQDGETTRTVTAQEHETIRTRIKQDGKTTRTEAREQHATARAVIAELARPAVGARSAATGAKKALSGHLESLFALSPTAAAAIGTDSLAILNAAAEQDADTPETGGLYL